MRRRTFSPAGSKFTVRGQVYIQTGAFFHAFVRRCPSCRKIRSGPVAIAAPVPRKAAAKKTTGRKARRASPRLATGQFEPRAKITLLEVRSLDVLPGETSATAMQRALTTLDGPAELPAKLAQCQRRDALGVLD